MDGNDYIREQTLTDAANAIRDYAGRYVADSDADKEFVRGHLAGVMDASNIVNAMTERFKQKDS